MAVFSVGSQIGRLAHLPAVCPPSRLRLSTCMSTFHQYVYFPSVRVGFCFRRKQDRRRLYACSPRLRRPPARAHAPIILRALGPSLPFSHSLKLTHLKTLARQPHMLIDTLERGRAPQPPLRRPYQHLSSTLDAI